MIKTKSLVAIIVLLILTTPGLTTAYAGHGSGGGGGCDNCTPPTLGIDKDGKSRVSGGISINSVPFDVELYSQNIPVQILNKYDKTIIVLKIFEDQGLDFVTHAELHFGPYEKVINGILVEHSIAHLVWHNEYGDEITGIYDDDEILKNVRIDTKNSDGFKIIIFEFEPTVVMDKTTLMTRVWDNERNVVNNYFIDAIKIIDGNNSELTQASKVQPTVPVWIKNNAEWWAQNQIDDNTFLSGVEYLIKNQVIQISKESQTFSQNSEEIPDWIKNNAEWWAQGLLSDRDFIKGIEYLVEHGIVTI